MDAVTTNLERRDTRFKPGNPGRPKGRRHIEGLLNDALKQAQKRRLKLHEPCSCALPEKSLWLVVPTRQARESDDAYQKRLAAYKDDLWAKSCATLDEHFARRAFVDATVLIAFQKKRIPDLQHQTGDPRPVTVNVLYGHRAAVQVAHPIVPEDGNGRDP